MTVECFLRGFTRAAAVEGGCNWSTLGVDGLMLAAGLGATERGDGRRILPVACEGAIGLASDGAGNPAGEAGSDAGRVAVVTEFRTIGRDRGLR